MDETEGEAGHEDGHRVRDRGGSGRVVATINLTRGIGQDARERRVFRGRVPGGRIENGGSGSNRTQFCSDTLSGPVRVRSSAMPLMWAECGLARTVSAVVRRMVRMPIRMATCRSYACPRDKHGC